MYRGSAETKHLAVVVVLFTTWFDQRLCEDDHDYYRFKMTSTVLSQKDLSTNDRLLGLYRWSQTVDATLRISMANAQGNHTNSP